MESSPTLKEFMVEIKRGKGTHAHKIHNSYGVYDAFKFYRKNKPNEKKWVLTEGQYYRIIRKINSILAENIAAGKPVRLPCRMGVLELRKYPCKPKIIEGKLRYNAPIDWDATLRLWYEDPEARENKTLIKIEPKDLFRVHYCKTTAIYKNKHYYCFQTNRDLKKAIAFNAKRHAIDSFLANY